VSRRESVVVCDSVETANAEQRAYWNGEDSREWVESPQRYDEMLEPFGAQLVAAVRPTAGERVLDVGCGNGATTLMLAAELAPDGASVGVDLSAAMIATARERAAAARLDNATFVVADAQVDDLGGPYDVAASRFGTMFFDDPDAACANVVAALTPHGRVSFVCWRPAAENEWVAVQARAVTAHAPVPDLAGDGPGPFRYGDPARLVRALERAGLRDVAAEPHDVPILLGGRGSFEDTLTFVRNSAMVRRLLTDATPAQAAAALAGLDEVLRPYRTAEGVRLGAAAWIVSGNRR
jgi:SAM-dependent methyltransferase